MYNTHAKMDQFYERRYKMYKNFTGLKKMFQGSQKYSQKGLLEILFSDVRKKIFYGKSCVFSKEKKWHRCGVADPCGSGRKLNFC